MMTPLPPAWDGMRAGSMVQLFTMSPRQRLTDFQMDAAARRVCRSDRRPVRNRSLEGVGQNAMLQSLSEYWRIANETRVAA